MVGSTTTDTIEIASLSAGESHGDRHVPRTLGMYCFLLAVILLAEIVHTALKCSINS
jgi:hypothetical protein